MNCERIKLMSVRMRNVERKLESNIEDPKVNRCAGGSAHAFLPKLRPKVVLLMMALPRHRGPMMLGRELIRRRANEKLRRDCISTYSTQ